VGTERGRIRRIAIVALARKFALRRYVTHGEVPGVGIESRLTRYKPSAGDAYPAAIAATGCEVLRLWAAVTMNGLEPIR
jgi:hypothetical protein